ncbi:MAG: cysteine--tRNA ligase [Candidatus Parvarchaeota archaeon]|nr:cysteine--tRNA ligase [Candidatus Parvarchaeota archaeon]
MKIYNTLSRKEDEFVPIEKGKVKMYCCGPTVYDYIHIGNLRTFIFYDILRRVFEHFGYEVEQVINLTDVDDKIIKNSRERKLSREEYTGAYTRFFFEDIEKVRIKPATVYPKATDNIDKMVEIIDVLLEKGFAYKTEDGIYYDISKFKDYGKLSGVKAGEGMSRIKADEYDKLAASDFALWKFWDESDGDIFWDKGIEKGRPGWHIECSAMSNRFLGDTIDIHSGAVDLIFPHHENEIAQSEAYTGKKFVNYWVHAEHLLVDGRKMSKSLHNFYTLRDLERLGFDPVSFRLMCLDTNYREKLNFTMDSLRRYEKTLNDINVSFKLLQKLEETDDSSIDGSIDESYSKFESALADNLNIPSALSQFFKLIEEANRCIAKGRVGKAEKRQLIGRLNDMNGILDILDKEEAGQEISRLAEERRKLRMKLDWSRADELRREVEEKGYSIVDMEGGDYVLVKRRRYISQG